MTRNLRITLTLTVLTALAVPAVTHAQLGDPLDGILNLPPAPTAANRMQVSATPSHTQVQPGETFHVALDIRLADGWVYYSAAPGGGEDGVAVQPARIEVSAEGPLQAGDVRWPPHRPYEYTLGEETLRHNVYKGEATAFVPVTVPPDAPAGTYRVTATFGGQICGEGLCLELGVTEPQSASAVVSIAGQTVAHPAWQDGRYERALAESGPAERGGREGRLDMARAFASDRSVAMWLALAVLAGLALNIMPCVLPVIPIRILSLVQMGHESRRRFVTLGLAFAGGILLFFAVLAGLNLAVRTLTEQTINVSEHFQYAPVRIAMALVLVALAANLFGVFTVVVPSRLAAADGGTRGEGHVRSAGMGLMMAVLATPCSFAILAAVLAWAQVQPPWLGSLALLLLGVGMAAPHVVLTALPQWVNRLPRPGRWMELFKQAMGFLLLPVAIWLLSTLSANAYPFWVAAYAVVLVFALWMGAQWVRYDAPARKKLLVRGSAVALAAVAGWFMLRPSAPTATPFAPYTPAAVTAAREAERPVLVKFTAAWCTSCFLIEQRVYDDPAVAAALAAANVLPLKADVTDRASAAGEFLYDRLHAAPPLTLIYPPKGPPIPLVGEFEKDRLLEVLKGLGGEE